MKNTIVNTTNLQIGYSNKKDRSVILDDINIKLKPQTLVSLLGINGCGKTTLLRTLAGLLTQISGNITIKDKSLTQYASSELSQLISIVLTERIAEDNLTVFDLLRIGRSPYLSWNGKLNDEDNFWIEKALELTDCKSLVTKRIGTLSDGQFQRVSIARAIAQNTPIIILDEPSSHLDLHHKVDLYILLKKLAIENNKAILFSSHDIDLCLEITDQSIVIQDHKCIQGSNNDLVDNGIFDSFFKSDKLRFDKNQRRFLLNL